MIEGQKASLILWGPEQGELVQAKDGTTLEFHDEYMGDHSEYWIIQKENGVEVSRHNTRYISTIVWAKEG